MREINCNIIKDLLPSYVDDICSKDSRLLVEEHLDDCEQCRSQLEMLKSTVLTDEQGEQKRISYLKKVKRHYDNGIIGLIFLALIITGGFRFMVYHYGMIEGNFFYIFFPLLIITAYCLMPNSAPFARPSKLSRVLVIGSIILSVYFLVLIYGSISINQTGNGPFGIPLHEVGPFLTRQLTFIAVVQFGIFLLANILLFRGYQISKCIHGLSLTGIGLAAGYSCILHNMSTVEGFRRLLFKMTGYLALEGILFSIAACFILKIKLKKGGNIG